MSSRRPGLTPLRALSGSDRCLRRGLRRSGAWLLALVVLFGVSVEIGAPPAQAQLGEPTTDCPRLFYGGAWQFEVAGMTCADAPRSVMRAAVDAVNSGAGPTAEFEGFVCAIDRVIRLAACRNPDGRGFFVLDATLGASPTPTSSVPPTTRPALPAATSPRMKDCGTKRGAEWGFGSTRGSDWLVYAQSTRCTVAKSRVAAVSAYVADPHIPVVFDVGPDRCGRYGGFGAVCAYGQAGTAPWGDRVTIAAQAPLGVFVVQTSRGAFALSNPPFFALQERQDSSGLGTPDNLCAPVGAPYTGADWEYGPGPGVVLERGNKWRVVSTAAMDCRDIKALVPRLTAPLARSVAVFESTVDGWSCLTARGSDLAGVHAITCVQVPRWLKAPEWFTIFQATPYNNHLVDRMRGAGPFGALSVAVSAGALPTTVKSCDTIENPRRPSPRAGLPWHVQATEMPCGLVKALTPYLLAHAAGLETGPVDRRLPGVRCERLPSGDNPFICELTNTSIFGGRTPRIGIGIGNEEVFAELTRRVTGTS